MNTQALRNLWRRLSRLPFGKFLFSRLIGFVVPYASSIGARIEAFDEGYGRVSLADRRKVRNHLGSIHAMALANLAELTANAAVLYSLPASMRMIVTDFNIRFEKKARGALTAECRSEALVRPAPGDVALEVVITDAQRQVVAVARQTCLLGLAPSKAPATERALKAA